MARARNCLLVAAMAAVSLACGSSDSLTGRGGSGGSAGASGTAGSGGTGPAGSPGSAGNDGAAGTGGGAIGGGGAGGGGGASPCASSLYPSGVCCRDYVTTMTEPFVCIGASWHCQSEILASSAATCPAGLSTGGHDGGAGGVAGGAGGVGGGASNPNGVPCLPVTMPLITDFTFVPDAGSTSSVHFGDDTTTFSGEEYVYPTVGAYPLSSDVSENNWHIWGTIGDYSGFGIAFRSCSRLDASAYGGISFTISGVVGAGSRVTMDVGTLDDTVSASWLDAHGGTVATPAPGACIPVSGTAYSHPGCADPTATVLVPAIPTTVSLRWSDFAGGQPESSVNPTGIVTIYWFFAAPAGIGTSSVTAYPVDIRLDDLKFIL